MTDTPPDEATRLDPTNFTDPWQAVRDGLEYFQSPLPHEAIAIAHANRDAVAPHLVQALEAVAADPEPALHGDHTLHIYAMLLLASWCDSRAWPALLAIGRFDEAVLDGLFGDSLTQSYGRALASICPGDTRPLQALIEDPAVLIWVRLGCLDAWKLRVMNADAPAEPFFGFLLDFGERLAALARAGEADRDAVALLSDLASQVSDMAPPRLLEPVRGWFDEGLIDEQHIDRAYFERLVELPAAERLSPRLGYIHDVAAEVSWWAAFSDDPRDDPVDDADEGEFYLPPAPIVRDGPKIGRNDPCPCGSGKKYKKCHGTN